MKKFIVIGLGNFGMNISKTLVENGCEVLGIDIQKNYVQKAQEFVTQGVIGDATNRSVLTALSLKEFDGAVVSIGQEMTASILISLYLKEIGVDRIIVRAISQDHFRILEMLGISDIVFPERDMAIRLGKTLSMKNALDYLPLTADYAIMDVRPPSSFMGKKIRDLQIGARYGCQILGIKYQRSEATVAGPTGMEDTKIAPRADDVIPENSVLIILGKFDKIEEIQQLD